MNLQTSDILQIIGISVSLLTSTVAIIISIITAHQNSKMIEESTRAIICIYGESINPGTPSFYMVVKNFGNSLATITKFETDFDFSDCYISPARDFLKDLSHCSIAPGHSHICQLRYDKIVDPITFYLEYYSSGKKHCEKYVVNLKSATSMPVSKSEDKNYILRNISYTLQEMLQKNL